MDDRIAITFIFNLNEKDLVITLYGLGIDIS
jgi:hypothetical protein